MQNLICEASSFKVFEMIKAQEIVLGKNAVVVIRNINTAALIRYVA